MIGYSRPKKELAPFLEGIIVRFGEKSFLFSQSIRLNQTAIENKVSKEQATDLLLDLVGLKCGVETVKILIDHGADPRANNSEALWRAAKNGQEGVVKILLSQGETSQEEKSVAMRWAASSGHKEIVKILIDHGADPRAEKSLALALRMASYNEHEGVVKILIDHGADF